MTRPESGSSASESHNTSEHRLGSTFMASMIRSALASRIIPDLKGSLQSSSQGTISHLLTGVIAGLLISYLPLPQIQEKLIVVPSVGWGVISTLLVLAVGPLSQVTFSEFKEFRNNSLPGTDKNRDEEGTGESQEGVIYARVSSDKQVDEGYSLGSQVESLKETAASYGVSLVQDPIKDKGKTGTNFRRPGIREVFRLAADGEITHLFVNDVSRIGRNAPETVYFVYKLQDQFDVTIILTNGPLDVDEFEDLMSLCFESLISQRSVQTRSQASIRSRIRRFVEDHNWSTWYPTVPLGYNRTNEDWLEINGDEISVVKNLFERFEETESYAETARYVNNRTDMAEETFSGDQVKRNLQRRVYIGKPTVNMKTDLYEKDELTAEDQNLQIINQELYERVQDIIVSKKERNSTNSHTKDVEDFAEIFGFLPMLEASPHLALHCPKCSTEMNKNGQRTLAGTEAIHNYVCPDCGRQRRFPTEKEHIKMQQTR